MGAHPVAVTTLVLRAMSVFCGIAVLGLIADKGRFRCELCIFNSRDEACRLGMAVGAVGFIAGTILLVLDTLVILADEVLEERASFSPFMQRAIDTLTSTAMAVIWIACFAVLLREWESRPFLMRRAMERGIPLREIDGQATLALCFINFGLWAALSILALVRWCQTPREAKSSHSSSKRATAGQKKKKKRNNEEDAGLPSEVHANDNWHMAAHGDFGPAQSGRDRTPSYGNRIYM
ncbi:synaptogyrin-3-like [Sycon ciliatum]|uniref:synaptogyrin-3-like n=1 Tax=Sycon ciliatum TaxID=27933 RepID=UPI0020ADCFB4|eukprot:scpid51355/ scgid18883/ 